MTRRRINTLTWAGVLWMALLVGAPGWWLLPSVARAAEIDAPKLDDGHVDQVYHMVEEWVRAGKVPATARPVRVTGMGGVRVTLRWLGLTVGVGEVRERDLVKSAEGGSVDLTGAALKATGDALTQVGQNVRQRGREASEPFLKLVGNLLVDLQVAGPTEPLRVDIKAEANEVYRQFAPGYHGLVMSRLMPNGQTREAWVWPASALAMNSNPERQLLQLLSDLGYSIADLEKVAKPDGPPMQRFTVRHMVRATPEQKPGLLVRGHVILPPTPLGGDQVKDLSQKLLASLLRRMAPQAGMVGTHTPVNGLFEPAVASEEEQALALYVVTRWALWRARQSPGDATALAAESAVRRGIERLWGKAAGGRPPDILRTPAVQALSLLTLTDSPVLNERRELRDGLAARLLAMQVQDGSFQASPEDPEPLNRPNHALVTAALTHYYDRTRDPVYAQAVRRASDWLWARAEPERIVRAMPWIIDVELKMGKLLSKPNVEAINAAPAEAPAPPRDAKVATQPAAPIRLEVWPDRAQQISELVLLLNDRQIVRAPQGAVAGPADVIGAFDLKGTPMGVPPNPDSDSVYPMLFIAAALRDPRMVEPGQRVAVLLAAGLGARFIAQLTFEPPSLYYARSPEDCLGGVRLALWDNRLANSTACMSLLALVELLESLDAIDQQGGLRRP